MQQKEKKRMKGGEKSRGDGEKTREEIWGKPSFGRGNDDTAHPSLWQVPAVAPLQRIGEERSARAPQCENTTLSQAGQKD